MSNTHGNDNRGVRKFLRSINMKPSVENVERIGRELRRTEQENEHMDRIGKEQGRTRLEDPHLPGTHNDTGNVEERVREQVQREMRERKR